MLNFTFYLHMLFLIGWFLSGKNRSALTSNKVTKSMTKSKYQIREENLH